MKFNIKMFFFAAVLLILLSPVAFGQQSSSNIPENPDGDATQSENNTGKTDKKSSEMTSETANDQHSSESLTDRELDLEKGAGFKRHLSSEELGGEIGAGFERVSPQELELTAGRGFGTDLNREELEATVGHGFIGKLSPDEIDAISARGNMSPTQIKLTTRALGEIFAQGVRFVVDKSKFSPEELEAIEGRGNLKEVGRAPYSVQIGLFKDRDQALTMLENVRKKGYDPYIFRTRDENGTPLFAVRLGDYETVQEAYAEVTHYKSKEHKEAFVTYINSLESVKKKDLMGDEDEPAAEEEAEVDLDKKYAAGDLKALYQQIKDLEKEVEKLRVEAEARKKLRMTKAEERQEEEEILSAVSRDYTMAEAGSLSLDYSFGYTHNSFDQANWEQDRIKHTADHTLSNRVSCNYSLYDNLRFGATIPFKYKYHDYGGDGGSKDVSDIGDISFSVNWQPFRTKADWPSFIVTGSYSNPTGRDPYEINPQKDLATGSGIHSISLGFTSNYKIDPVVLFGGMSYSHQMSEDGLDYQAYGGGRTLKKVDPGDGIAASLGIGYAMSYKATINASISASYAFETTYRYASGFSTETSEDLSASLTVGTGFRFSTERTISFNVGMGLTNDAADFTFSFRIPFDFEL